jgi:hypothetical protein
MPIRIASSRVMALMLGACHLVSLKGREASVGSC